MGFLMLLRQDLRLHRRGWGEWAPILLFFLIVIILLPFAIGPEPDLLHRLAPGLIWLAALLMSLLVLERLFVRDARDGTLDLMLLSPHPLPLIIFSRLVAEILMLLLALGLMLLPAVILLGLSLAVLPVLVLTLLLGMPAIILLGGIAGAVTASLHRNPGMLTLLLIPFYIPIMIFAVAACDAATGGGVLANILLLAAILVLVLPFAPFIIAAALRNGQS